MTTTTSSLRITSLNPASATVIAFQHPDAVNGSGLRHPFDCFTSPTSTTDFPQTIHLFIHNSPFGESRDATYYRCATTMYGTRGNTLQLPAVDPRYGPMGGFYMKPYSISPFEKFSSSQPSGSLNFNQFEAEFRFTFPANTQALPYYCTVFNMEYGIFIIDLQSRVHHVGYFYAR
jgi:hypothetical protein